MDHYNSFQQILLVGEGDFSFSASLARSFGYASNMVATSLDSEGDLWAKHPGAVSNLNELRRRGCLVLHGVDACSMDSHPHLSRRKFDVIVFNFPHAGHYCGLSERNPELIQMHQELLDGFFQNAGCMLNDDGEIHVTTRDDYPYNTWDVEGVAEAAGLVLIDKVLFEKSDYPGYQNKRGGEIMGNKTFRLRDCYTFIFSLQYDDDFDDGMSVRSEATCNFGYYI